MFADFINQYGMEILAAVITAIAGYIGIVLKSLCTKFINDKTKREVAKDAVKFVEQVYKNLKGEEKLNTALGAASEMLAEKGIIVSELEMRVLIEAAVAEFNNAFKKTTEEV
jgi:intergrase/recombinase